MWKRHPDIFLKSHASFLAKLEYLRRNLNRQPQKEKAFPFFFMFDYNKVIWPRCQLLLAKDNRNFDLIKVCAASDADFCDMFGIE